MTRGVSVVASVAWPLARANAPAASTTLPGTGAPPFVSFVSCTSASASLWPPCSVSETAPVVVVW